jgi:translocation and assembly module TamB
MARYVQTPRFRGWIRARCAGSLEQFTGGRVELGALAWNLPKLQLDVRSLTIHGLESPGEVPYLQVDRLAVRLKILSLFRREFGFRQIELDHPVVHLIVYPDGSTNQPEPRRRHAGKGSPVEQLFAMNMDHAEVRNGLLAVNQQSWPLDFRADDLEFLLAYMRGQDQYQGSLRLGKIEITSYRQVKAVPAAEPESSFRRRAPVLSPASGGNGNGKHPAAGAATPPLSASGEVRFTLWRDHARLDFLQVSTPRSQLQASGALEDFNHPVVQFTYSARLDGAELGSALRLPEMRNGVLALNGKGLASAQAFSSSGKLALRDFDGAAGAFRVPRLSGGAQFQLTNEKLALPHIFVSLLGGVATGDLEVLHWRSSASEQEAAAHLTLHNLLLARIADAAATPALPLNRLKAVGVVNGPVVAHWRGSPAKLIAALALDLASPASSTSGELPVSGRLKGTFDNAASALKLDTLNLAAPATQLSATGVLAARSTMVNLAVRTHGRSESGRVAAALAGLAPWPVALYGTASFNGTLTGRLSQPHIAGHLEAADFDSEWDGGEPRRIHWDALAAGVDYASSLLTVRHARLLRGATRLDFDGAARLENGRLTESSSFTMHAGLHNFEVADLLYAAGSASGSHIKGKLNATVQFSGTEANPQGRARLVITAASIYDQPVQRLSANITVAPAAGGQKTPLGGSAWPMAQVDFSDIQITQNESSVTGTAGYNPATTAYSFRLRGTGLNLAKLRWLQTKWLALAGKLSFAVSGSGSEDEPALNADVQVRDLAVNGQLLGGIRAGSTTTGDTLRLTVQPDSEKPGWQLNGAVRMHGDFPAKLNLVCDQVSLEPLERMSLIVNKIENSTMTGAFTVEGPLRSPHDLTLNADISRLSLDIEHIPLHNEGPIRFALTRQTLHLQQFQLVGTDTALTAAGSLELAGEHELDMQAKGQMNLTLLQGLDPTISSRGMLALDLRAGGALPHPRIQGSLDVTNAAISQLDWPNGLSDLNGRLVFNEDRLQIQNLQGKSGGGAVDLSGFIAYGRGISLNVSARGHDIRLRYPAGVSSMAEADLRMTGTPQHALLSGQITVTRFDVNPQFDFATYLSKAWPPVTATSASFASDWRLDVHLVSTPELQVQTSQANVSGDVDLRLRGTPVRPVLLGRVNISEGDIDFNGTKYHLERGGISFSNPVTIDPVLDMEATTAVRDYDITLGLHGPLDKLSTVYRSDPPLATADIVSLLAFGSVREELAASSAGASNLTPEAQTILSQALNAAVGSRVQKLFGVSRIKIDPQAGGAESNPAGPRLTIEQQMSKNITLTYVTDVTRANYQSVQAEYNISHNLSGVAIRDWNGVVSFEIRIRQRKK